MEKKLTLNQTWKYCLQQWKWVSEQIKKNPELSASDLKREWMKEHPQFRNIANDCFFCAYAIKHDGFLNLKRSDKPYHSACSACPGRLVNRKFGCELYTAYNWLVNPLNFYAKILGLDKKRKAK